MATTMHASFDERLEAIRAEFDETPALRLTRPQFSRLWSLDGTECERLVETLLTEGFLDEDESGQLVHQPGLDTRTTRHASSY